MGRGLGGLGLGGFTGKSSLIVPNRLITIPSNIGAKTFTISILRLPGCPVGFTFHCVMVGGGGSGNFAPGNGNSGCGGGGGQVFEGDMVAVNGDLLCTIGKGGDSVSGPTSTTFNSQSAGTGANAGVNQGGGSTGHLGGGGLTTNTPDQHQAGGGGAGTSQAGFSATMSSPLGTAGNGGSGILTAAGMMGGGGGGGAANFGQSAAIPG